LGEFQIAVRQRHPFPGLARIWLEEMRKGKTRAQAGPVRPVEFKQAWRWPVAQSVRAALNQSFADPTSIEAPAFQGQKRQLIERVHQAKGTTEFQAIDDDWRIGKADMF